jgi:hypothetical protein
MNKIKVALFDFCKTLVKLNTLSEFVNFCLNSKNLHIPNKKFKKIFGLFKTGTVSYEILFIKTDRDKSSFWFHKG